MFTGIIEGTGEVRERVAREQGSRLWISFRTIEGELTLGQSIAINGACLTVAEQQEGRTAFDLAGETLALTNLGDLKPGDLVNYERSLRLGDRLDGHIVQGHVDGVGRIQSLGPRGDDYWLEVSADQALLEQMIYKGSITVNGISLTIAELGAASLGITIIPHTREITNLHRVGVGDRVNLEVDMVGKWIRRMVAPALPPAGEGDA